MTLTTVTEGITEHITDAGRWLRLWCHIDHRGPREHNTVGFYDISWVRCRKEAIYQGHLPQLMTSLSSSECAHAPSLYLVWFKRLFCNHGSISRLKKIFADLYMHTKLRNDPSLAELFAGLYNHEVFAFPPEHLFGFFIPLWHEWSDFEAFVFLFIASPLVVS